MPNEQHFPAWPLITAVITPSPRAGAYTAKVEFPHAPVRILKRSELPPLRREVIAKVQQWTNDEWRKPVRLQVEDPDGRWVLGVPRDGPIVELDTIAAVEPPVLRTVSPASPPLPAAGSSIRRPRQPSAPSAQRTARPRRSSHRALRPRVLAAGALTLMLAASAYALASTELGARPRPGDRTHDTAEQRRQRRVSGDHHAHPDNGGRHPSRRRENRCAPLNPSRASASTPRPAPATASDAPPCASQSPPSRP